MLDVINSGLAKKVALMNRAAAVSRNIIEQTKNKHTIKFRTFQESNTGDHNFEQKKYKGFRK